MKEYVLDNGLIRFSILDIGASITSLKFNDGSKWHETTLKYQDYDLYSGDNPYFLNCIVGPHAGRIKDAKYVLNGKEVNLEKTSSGNHLHGGKNGFHTLVFSVEEKVNQLILNAFDSQNSIEITLIYTLLNSNLIIEMKALPHHDQVINMTQHTYFNLSDEPTIHNHFLQVEARCVAALDKTGVPMSYWLDVAGTPFDFFAKRKIGTYLEMYHSQFSISNNIDHPFKTNKGSVSLESDKSRIGVNISSDAEYTVLYAANYFDKDVMLSDRGEAIKHGALAVEPQDLPNDVNIGSSRSQIYGPDNPFSRKIKYSFYYLD